jgi:hypothetical protein
MDCEIHRLQEAGLSFEAALATIREHDRQAIERFGWVAHHIVDSPVPTAHTHGLRERFDHPDLQVVLPASPETIQRLLAPVAQAVVNGRTFCAGEEATDVFNVPVRFVARTESGRGVLRVLFPDPNGRWPDDPGVEPGYDLQLADIED